jgi:chorismate mutase/prephenate dehydratase
VPSAELTEVSSTSVAAQRAHSEQGAAAVGSPLLADVHGLRVLFERIEDCAHNVTRFFVLGREMSQPTGDDKTALLCGIRDKVGALQDLLLPIKELGVNLTKIESFPSPSRAWEYYFFIDFQGHPSDPNIGRLLDMIRQECVSLKVLGAFPRFRA